jgi:hypothetical protein
MLKKLTLVVAVMLACSIFGSGQSIYSLTNREIASIPFRFSVGNMVLPAGNYTFVINLQKHIVVVQDENRKAWMFQFNTEDASTPASHGQVVFGHYDPDLFVLQRLRLNGSTVEARLVPGKIEKEIARAEKAGPAVALLTAIR